MTSVFGRRRSRTGDRRGWASHSVSRSWQTIDDPENARTGPSAWGRRLATARALCDRHRRMLCAGRTAAPTELLIVDLIAEHDIQAYEELAGQGHFGLRPPASMQDGEVAAPQIVVRPPRQGRRWAQPPAKERITLLGDLAEVVFVGRSVDHGGQANVTHDMLAVRESVNWSQHKDRRQGGQGPDAGMREQSSRARIRFYGRRELLVELVDAAGDPREQLQAVVTPASGVRRQGQASELGEAPPRPQRRPERQALVEGDRLQTIFNHRPHANQTDAVRDEPPTVPVIRSRHPDRRQAIVLEQVQQMPRVAPIGLRFSDHHGSNLSCLANEDGGAEPGPREGETT